MTFNTNTMRILPGLDASGLTNVNVSNLFNPTFQDNRPVSNTCLFPSGASTNLIIFTNAGPGTVTRIELSGSTTTATNTTVLKIVADGTTNECPIYSFLCADGLPMIKFHGGNVDLTWSGPLSGAYTITGGRNVYINFRTNCYIAVTNPTSTSQFSTVYWRVGQPVTASTWHSTYTQSNVFLFPGVFTPINRTNATGQIGQVESFYLFILDPGGQQSEITPPIAFYLDGKLYNLGAGTEDSFGGSWGWDGFYDMYQTPKWGVYFNPVFQNFYGLANVNGVDGLALWRFFTHLPDPEPQYYFTNTFSWNWSNTFSADNEFLIGFTTYQTVP
jgi:hypothetical protein